MLVTTRNSVEPISCVSASCVTQASTISAGEGSQPAMKYRSQILEPLDPSILDCCVTPRRRIVGPAARKSKGGSRRRQDRSRKDSEAIILILRSSSTNLSLPVSVSIQLGIDPTQRLARCGASRSAIETTLRQAWPPSSCSGPGLQAYPRPSRSTPCPTTPRRSHRSSMSQPFPAVDCLSTMVSPKPNPSIFPRSPRNWNDTHSRQHRP